MLKRWAVSVADVFRKELHLSFHDIGVIIFFVVLGFVYPILYSLIYNTETTRDVKVLVVDESRSSLSREYARRLDATPEVRVLDYAADMGEARRRLAGKEAYGIVYFPSDFASDIGRGNQGYISLYCDMSVLMRYKQIVSAMTAVQQAMCVTLQGDRIATIGMGLAESGGGTSMTMNDASLIESQQVPLGNTSMGIASAILPAILVMVLQQAMLLGICMLRGGSRERRLYNKGVDPEDLGAPVGATIWGKTLAYLLVFTIPMIFVLLVVPIIFDFPQNANPVHVVLFVLPMFLAVSFLGQSLQVLVNERESTFLVLVFTSVIFIFLSGISWPRHAMGPLWVSIGNMIPSTWACNGYILMMTDGASLNQVQHNYYILWLLAALYFVLAYCIERFVCRPRYRRMMYYEQVNPGHIKS